MTLTPQEIQTQEFHVRFRGFDVEEVDAFLEKIAADFLELMEQNKKLAEQVESLNQEMSDYQSKGKAFQHAILSAQQIADDLMDKSKAEAEKLIEDARGEASEIKETAAAEVASLEAEVDRLQSLRDKSRTELQNMLHSYLDMLEAPIPSYEKTVESVPEPEPEPEPMAETATEEPVIEDDLSDLYQKIDLPDNTISAQPDEEIAHLEQEEETMATEDNEPYAAIPNLDDDVVFDLEDPLDANEPSVNFENLVSKDDK